jgi:plastocyanin
MMNHMMNDPQMQQQMMNHMMNHPQIMQQWMQNQQYFDSLSDDDKTETSDDSTSSQSTQVSIAHGSASPGCEETNECYLPYSVTISEHSGVTWTNDDIAVHTVTSGIPSDGHNGIFDSGLISPGSTFTNQIDEDGTFDYYSIAHPWMPGKVVVEE